MPAPTGSTLGVARRTDAGVAWWQTLTAIAHAWVWGDRTEAWQGVTPVAHQLASSWSALCSTTGIREDVGLVVDVNLEGRTRVNLRCLEVEVTEDPGGLVGGKDIHLADHGSPNAGPTLPVH